MALGQAKLFMPFDLSYAPSTFQRLMERCFGDFNFKTVLVYLDDFIIFCKNFEERVEGLDWVLAKNTKHIRRSTL